MLSISHYKLYFWRYEASKMGRGFLDFLTCSNSSVSDNPSGFKNINKQLQMVIFADRYKGKINNNDLKINSLAQLKCISCLHPVCFRIYKELLDYCQESFGLFETIISTWHVYKARLQYFSIIFLVFCCTSCYIAALWEYKFLWNFNTNNNVRNNDPFTSLGVGRFYYT